MLMLPVMEDYDEGGDERASVTTWSPYAYF
jgi:hypothetical protein